MTRFLPGLLALVLVVPAPLLAQDAGLVEALAPILMAEDRRALDPQLFAQAIEHPDPRVRRAAVVAIGRIGDPNGLPFLVARLQDRDQGVLGDAFFALGLLRAAGGVAPMLERLRAADTLDAAATGEAAIALARIGGPAAAATLAEVIGGGGDLPRARREEMLLPAMLESWRLGSSAPVRALEAHVRDRDVSRRWRALYVLGRLQVPSAGEPLLEALRDPTPLLRETAAKVLTRRYADSAGLAAAVVVAELRRATDDQDPGVRVNALGALGTFGDTTAADAAIARLNDPDRNVRVAAAGALGAISGGPAVAALESVFTMKDAGWALERAALAALAQADTSAFQRRVAPWLASSDPLTRAAALQLLAGTRPGSDAAFRTAVTDRDARVRAAALGGWASAGPAHRAAAADAGRAALRDPEALVRVAAVGALDPAATPTDLDLLATAWRGGDLDTREAVLQQLGRLSRTTPDLLSLLIEPARRPLLERPAEADLRALAVRVVPQLGTRWGALTPVETGRTLEDYRGIVRTLMLARENPQVVIEVEGRGTIEVELLAREAPLTVANFLQLVDRRYFDGNRWHRVVPNFVVQDGDRTGLGNGGPGWSIRDEINRRQYDVPMLGMALSGPNTGGSQWFINLSPQPHLNGQYTIFGRVTGSYGPLKRVLQGDVIRTIARRGRP